MIPLLVFLLLAVVAGAVIAVLCVRRAMQREIRELRAQHDQLSAELRAQQTAATVIRSAFNTPHGADVPAQRGRSRRHLQVIHGGKAVWVGMVGAVGAAFRWGKRPAVTTTLAGAAVAASVLVSVPSINDGMPQVASPEADAETEAGAPRLVPDAAVPATIVRTTSSPSPSPASEPTSGETPSPARQPAATQGTEDPAEPAESAEPAEPAEPAVPADPKGPGDRAQPAEPAEPADPASPADPPRPCLDLSSKQAIRLGCVLTETVETAEGVVADVGTTLS